MEDASLDKHTCVDNSGRWEREIDGYYSCAIAFFVAGMVCGQAFHKFVLMTDIIHVLKVHPTDIFNLCLLAGSLVLLPPTYPNAPPDGAHK